MPAGGISPERRRVRGETGGVAQALRHAGPPIMIFPDVHLGTSDVPPQPATPRGSMVPASKPSAHAGEPAATAGPPSRGPRRRTVITAISVLPAAAAVLGVSGCTSPEASSGGPGPGALVLRFFRSEEHTSELQSLRH